MKPQPLEALTFPLRGSGLIEAGAGTGKTYTIAQLYTRLVLGHGSGETRFSRPLEPREILVVTFSQAAVMELRDRIRRRLREAAEVFSHDPHQQDGELQDRDLRQLRDSLDNGEIPRALSRLLAASEAMDDAAIFTIHGWCYRTLQRYAIESGLGFARETGNDTTILLEDAVKDYWRSTFYRISPQAAGVLTEIFSGPQDLLAAITPLPGATGGRPFFRDQPRAVPEEITSLLEQAGRDAERLRSLYEEARALWRNNRSYLHGLLDDLRPFLHGGTYRGIRDDVVFRERMEEMDQWSREKGDESSPPSFLLKLVPEDMRLTKGHAAPEHPFFTKLQEWKTTGEARDLRPLAADVMIHATREAGLRFEKAKRTEGLLDFDDMLSLLAQALREDREGTGILAESIRREFPFALVDEFQDTDEVQYSILDMVYHIRKNDAGRGLFCIGDPKQSIYRFRGADIYTYLRARKATTGRHFSLTRNYRSTGALVAATNVILTAADRHERGAFLFGRGTEGDVPFIPAEPREDAVTREEEALTLDGAPAPPITIWTMPEMEKPIASGEFLSIMAEQTASCVARWLQDGESRFSSPGKPDRPVTARDIAVLVRNGKQAEALLAALGSRGIAGVYLSTRDSVFSTREAADAYRWLRAILQPEDDTLLRAALATPATGLTLDELERIAAEDHLRDFHMNRFTRYHRILYRDGVLPAFRALLQDYRIPARLLSDRYGAGGERSLTNLLHLAEWLHQADREVENRHELVHLLLERRNQPGEEQILRLERDDQCIRVVTIFKAKGLQYEIVLAPFLCMPPRDVRAGANRIPPRPLLHQDGERGRVLEYDPAGAPRAMEAVEEELLSEEMRLFYVALTRSRFATFLAAAPVYWKSVKQGVHKTGFGYTLAGGKPIDSNEELLALLADMRGDAPGIVLEPAGPEPLPQPPPATRATEGAEPAIELRARAPNQRQWKRWWIASYSALGAGTSRTRPDTPYPPEPEISSHAVAEEDIASVTEDDAPEQSREPLSDIHRFPAGAGPGTFLHELIEAFADEGFRTITQSPEARRKLVERACTHRGWAEWSTPVDAWMKQILDAALTPGTALPPTPPLVLGDLDTYQAEMEFLFPSAGVSLDRMDRIVRSAVLKGHERPRWSAPPIQGLFKGFIDLVFLHDRRYYLLDWKSNRLGSDRNAYGEEALRATMLEKRYDLQLSLYTLALHRHLRRRLPDYDYDRHFGGALYLFLRGVDAEGSGLFAARIERPALEELDTLFQQGEEG